MSSSEEHREQPRNEEESGAAGAEEEAAAADAVAMETTTADDDDDEPSTWDLAREASSRMVLQSHLDDMETRAAKQKEELQQFRRRAEDAESSLETSRDTIQGLEANLRSEKESKDLLSKKMREITKEAEIAKESVQTEKERADRTLAESDQLREEISRLAKSNMSYQKQLAENEAKAKLDDSSILPLQFKSQRLETENDNLRTHSTWLEGELTRKSEDLSALKSKSALESARARASVDAAQSERDELVIEAKQLRGQLERIQSKAEGLSRQVLEAKQEASDVKLDSEQELTASRRLVELQKEQLIRMKQKHDALAQQVTSMKLLAQQAETEDEARWKEREIEFQQLAQRNLKSQADEYENRILSMKEEIEAVNRRCQRAEDGLMLVEDAPETVTAPARLTNAPADSTDEPISMTDLYGRVAKAEDALHAEVIRRKKAEIRVTRIEQEIEANAPFLLRQRKEYELALQRQKELQSRLENALDEASAIRNESDMMEDEVNRLKKENKDLTEEAKILAKQVRDMLIANSGSGTSDPNVALTVSQMGAANTRLMKEYNALTAKVKELETTISQQDDLHQEIQDLKAVNASLEEQRKREESMVDKIVQQRDLYRVLLNKQDTNLLGAGEDENDALAIVRGQSERTKALEAKHQKLITEHAEAQAKLDVMIRDQETASERLLRYEMLNDELTKSIDKLKNEMDKNAAAVARSKAEADFFKEKVELLEDAQLRNKEEIKNVTASKNRIMTLNTDLEQSIVKANTERSKMEDQLRQAQSKLMLAQAEAESAKAAERRVSEESAQLRIELARQGAVLDGVQRIESSLMMKNNADMEAYKLEATALKEKLALAEKKHEADLQSLKENVADHELQVKQLEGIRAKAAKEALDAKKESLAAIKKADAATKKSSLLEGQLRAAKKKLGETGGENEPDVETELRSKLESITTDLEGAKKETETWKKRAATYEKLAKDNEKTVSDVTEASKAASKLHDDEMAKLNEELQRVNSEMSKRTEMITELTNDLSVQREEREKAVNEVKQEIAGFKTDAENYQKKAEDAESRFSQVKNDLTALKAELNEAQTNYERELSLHAAARTDLRAAREENETANRLRNEAMEEAATLQSKFKIQESSLEAEKSKHKEATTEFKTKLESTRSENALLHAQLEKIHEQVESMQTRYASASEDTENKADEIPGDEEMLKLRMTVSELRELVKFVRAEKDAIEGQLDSAKRSIERERTKASVARRTVEETQAELNAVRESMKNTSGEDSENGTSMADKLKTSEEQSRLLSDSNAHLQQQVQELQKNLANARQEVDESKKALQPAADVQKQLESDKAVLLTEKESLLREISDWKGRVQSLVSKFNQVDPEEHLKVVKKSKELEKQVESLEEKKSTAEEDAKRIRTLASRASSELSKNKQLVESQKKTIAKLTLEKTALVKSQKEAVSTKEIDELKAKMATLEEERKAEKIQAKGSTEMNEKLRNRLREFQKQILELRKQTTTLNKQLEEARSKTEEKEAEAAKAIAALKEKESTAAATVASGAADSATNDTTASAKTSTATPKQSVATPATTTTSSNDSKTASTTTTTTATATATAPGEKKEEKKVMPKVPPGGFKFAPSKVVETTNTKKRSATELGKDESSGSASQFASQKKPAVESKSSTDKAVTLSPTRRNSGEIREMSFKEKLLEKKRKLQELKKAKEALKEESKTAEPVTVEPETKRNKTESTDAKEKGTPKPEAKADPPALNAKAASFVPSAAALKAAAAKMASKTKTAETAQVDEGKAPEVTAEDGEMEEGEEVTKTKQPPKADTPTPSGTGPSTGSIFGGGASSSQSTFGSGFGKGTAVGAFGSGASATFGKGSAFGSGGTGLFGTSSSSSSSSKKADAGSAPASGFGSAAFLDIKPPGSSTGSGLPQFSFGTSGSSITLPTPGAATTPKMTMFNAFASPVPSSQPFGGQASAVTAKPLFGATTQEKKDDKGNKDEEEEDGEVPSSEETNKK